ncbi:MAG: hypothetical protein CSA52_03585 [Gammaproteobacteria bacterium]|nr:MAG: hypothetical protein CSB48_05990 [Pseudomonadota bacterium]PIE38109.1 MAG: hypothetical protein CSA52_03585 [Gammaproteobacteria bacterium]
MSGESQLKLDKNMGIANAGSFRYSLTQLFGRGTGVIIDAADVERIDTSIVQLVYSFVSSMKQAGLTVEISRPSEAFSSSASRLGFSGYFGLEGSEQGIE